MSDYTPEASRSSQDVRDPGREPGLVKRPAEQQESKERSASLWADAWRELRRNPVFMLSSLLVVAVISMAAFPSLWTDSNPERCLLVEAFEGPSATHVFGTTVQGCDMYAHVVYGARPSIIIGVLVTAAVTVIGCATGIVSGFYGGWTDTIVSRITDVFLGLPLIVGALVFLALLTDRNIWTVSLVLVVLSWPTITRIMRGSVISVKAQDYIEAARSLGASNASIISRHVLPNAIAPVIVLATLYVGVFVSAEATLTFLGVGLQIPEISWGITISEGQLLAVNQNVPHLLVFPCAALILTVLSFILMGDTLRDALDPKGR
jgi:peptide/nickel transport system permease protein/oligopeptide transport system permease protein